MRAACQECRRSDAAGGETGRRRTARRLTRIDGLIDGTLVASGRSFVEFGWDMESPLS